MPGLKRAYSGASAAGKTGNSMAKRLRTPEIRFWLSVLRGGDQRKYLERRQRKPSGQIAKPWWCDRGAAMETAAGEAGYGATLDRVRYHRSRSGWPIGLLVRSPLPVICGALHVTGTSIERLIASAMANDLPHVSSVCLRPTTPSGSDVATLKGPLPSRTAGVTGQAARPADVKEPAWYPRLD